MNNNTNKIINISKKTFINVLIILGTLMILTIILTYVVPKGAYNIDSNGNVLYDEYVSMPDVKGINIFKGIFSPILLLFSNGGISVIMLSIFLLFISGAFQIMNDVNGMKTIVNKLICKFKNHKKVLIGIIVLIFMSFGSFFGLFEETLTLLPLIIMLSLSLGYDSYTGFLMCTVATGLGFASAITNPFTVITASEIIEASQIDTLWFRIIIFIVMYGLLLLFIRNHIMKLERDKTLSPTYEQDLLKSYSEEDIFVCNDCDNNRVFKTYIIFLSLLLVFIITITSISSLRDYTVVFLIVYFLIGGLISGYVASNDFNKVANSFLSGIISALPTLIMILMASSIKYILEEGMILDTITNSITMFVQGKNTFVVALIILVIVLILEFMISSSTAKAIFVMSILGGVSLGISKELLVLIYILGDGYTNILFPTSPVLLISLGMTGMSYTKWLNKSKWLFVIIASLVVMFIMLGVLLNI